VGWTTVGCRIEEGGVWKHCLIPLDIAKECFEDGDGRCMERNGPVKRAPY